MTYANEGQFDRALKKSIRASGANPGDGYRQALRDRFLCRVFSDPESRFVLKGGSGLLARIPDARATKDIDFATAGRESAESALEALNKLVTRDAGDFLTFRLSKCSEARDENGYSRLLKLRYATYLGHEEKDPILIDLSLDCLTTQPPERIEPANRFYIDGIETCKYLVYPLSDQLADKLCAIMELQPGGFPSSRMKDLVDVVFYVTNRTFVAGELRVAIESECAKRHMDVPDRFGAPELWRARFELFARKSGLPKGEAPFEAASEIAAMFFDPVLAGRLCGLERWHPKELCWK